MRNKILFLALVFGFLLMGGVPAEVSAADKIVIRLSHSNQPDTTHPFHNAALKIKDQLEARLGKDRVEVQIYPAGQLGGEERGVQDLQQGIIQLTILSINNASVFATSMMAFDLPYIFKSEDEFFKCVRKDRSLLNEYFEKESGTYAVLWMALGFRTLINSKHPVTNLGELADIKVRVPNNPIMIAAYKSWGNQAVPIAYDETFNAVQQKVVDGLDNATTAHASQRYYEMCKYFTDIHYKLTICPILTSAAWLKSLPEDVRTALLEVCLDIEQQMIDEFEATDQKARKILRENGVRFGGAPTDEDQWMARAMAVWPQFYPKMKSPTILEAIMKTVGRDIPK